MRFGLIIFFGLLLAFAMIGCEGEEGPQGPAGPPGDDATVSPYTYLGNGGEDCMHCHATTVSSWHGTNHYNAYTDLEAADQDNPYCVKCHTTGWDSEVAYGDTTITTYGPDTTGFDDYFGKDTEEAAMRRAALAGVQCEACHGPMGPEFNAHKPEMSFATRSEDGESLSLCAPCHNGQLEEWTESGHGAPVDGDHDAFNEEHYAHISSCNGCHTSEGFIRDNDPAFANYEFGEDVSFIGCVTCHDPHAGTNEHQVRTTGMVEVEYHPGYEDGDPEVASMSGYGAAQVCAQCHHGRRDTDNVESQILNGYAHFGPHSSPQMDMFLGAGSYELPDSTGYSTYESSHAHQNVEDACVECHMVREEIVHGELQDHSFHTFQPTAGNCEPCHTVEDFDVNGVQTDVMAKMDDLAVLLGYTDTADFDANFNSQADGVTVAERQAAYALVFVMSDGSYGVHNPHYTMDLLDNAIDYLTLLP